MTTPFDHFIEWLGQLPMKYKQDLVSEISVRMPGVDVNPYHRQFLDHFMERLATIRKQGFDQEYELFISLKGVIDNIVQAKNQENANWEKEKNELDDLVKMTGSCSFATAASEKAMQYHEWKDIGEKWNELVSRLLTQDRIDLCQPSA